MCCRGEKLVIWSESANDISPSVIALANSFENLNKTKSSRDILYSQKAQYLEHPLIPEAHKYRLPSPYRPHSLSNSLQKNDLSRLHIERQHRSGGSSER